MKKIMIVLFFTLLTINMAAPPSNSGVIFVSEGINPFEPLFDAVSFVESSGDPEAIGDKHLKGWSYGIVQVRQSRLDDYYRRTGIRYTLVDMLDPVKAKQVFMYYASQHNENDFETISREWNGGYNWRRKEGTRDYWTKVRDYLNKRKPTRH